MVNKKTGLIILVTFLIAGVFFAPKIFNTSAPQIRGAQIGGSDDDFDESRTERSLVQNENIDPEKLLTEVAGVLDVKFIQLVDGTFAWKTGDEAVEVIGDSIVFTNRSEKDETTVTAFFENEGFVQSSPNVSQTVNSRNYGYLKNNTVCIIRTTTSETSETVGLEIRCGYLLSDEELQTSEYQLKRLLAQKYETDISVITIQIIQETDEHVSGLVQFTSRGIEGAAVESADSGSFLAAKDSGTWILVFDGNAAIRCDQVNPYEFPAEMVPECFDAESGEVVSRN